jgi:low temperature requirement protein LtrA
VILLITKTFNNRAMFKNRIIPAYIGYSVLSAMLFCITVIYFVAQADYTDTWVLYVGNGLFMIGVVLFMIYYNKRKNEDASSTSLVMSGHIVVIAGIVLSCIISFIILAIGVPGLFQSGQADKVLADSLPTVDTGKTDGLIFFVYMNAIVGNVATGSFAAIIFAYTVKRDQTEDTAEVKYKMPK